MKKLSLLSVCIAGILLSACQTTANDQADNKPVVELTTTEQKEAYAIGSSISRYINKTLLKQGKVGVNLDREIILQGLKQGLFDNALMTEDEEKEVLKALDKRVTVLVKNNAEKGALENLELGKAFLEQNAKREGVIVTDSGLQYQVITATDGAKPTAENVVTVHYVGTLIDGSEFDSSIARATPASFPLNRVIKGWIEGVQLMSVGSKFKFFIPSELAYGEGAHPKIPANSTLIFEVELLSIKDKS